MIHALTQLGLSVAHYSVLHVVYLTSLLGKQWHLGTIPHCAGTAARGQRVDDEIQPAEASAAVTSEPMATSARGKQPAPRRVVQETDDGKARFVCCGFGGKKAGSRGRRKT